MDFSPFLIRCMFLPQIIRIGGMPELPNKALNFLPDQINLIVKAASSIRQLAA
jgi:hypothetical protein